MASSSSSTSSTAPAWTYDVFLSFRGQDTRFGFTSHLYDRLRGLGIHAFVDYRLERGEEISASLLEAIERSEIALVIFSQNYASSGWCLDELVKIMECRTRLDQVVMPIFYRVDPSDVRHQTGTYGEAMERHEQGLGTTRGGTDRVLRWREALTAAASLAGFPVSEYEDESKPIEAIVEDVFKKIDIGQLVVAEHPVGIETRVHEFTIDWSEQKSQKPLIIGLYGMGGVGKTTIAKAIYNTIGREFRRSRSFLANINKKSKDPNDQVNLQNQLIFDITKTQVFKVHNIDEGKQIIQKRFPSIKAFVVLDDVGSVDQLKALCGSLEWLCPGSVIVITTRDQHLLDAVNVDHKYEIKEMKGMESLWLFSWHAFKQPDPFENFEELSENVVGYCDGLPLALEILGAHLRRRTIEEWKDVLSKLERIPNKDIQAKLRISYDGLNDYMEKDIFLDICCFFMNKDRNYVTQILDGCRLHAKNGLQILIEKSLIKVDDRNNKCFPFKKKKKLVMHSLLLEMGKEIIRESSPRDPEERSRLWLNEDVLEVLTEHTGTKAIEGISLEMPKMPRDQRLLIDAKAFKKMRKLRLLRLDYVNVEGDYKYLSRRLRWLCWHGFPLKYTPNNFYQKNLVAIELKDSNLQVVWKEPKLLEMLKTLNLSHSSNLTQTPDFTYLPNLERLVMKDCQSLILIHESIGVLKNLLHVNLNDCESLKDLPRSIYKLKSVKTLILSGCSLIDHLEEDIEQMESLTTLMADKTAIKQVPRSLARLKGLKHGKVSLCGYEGSGEEIFPSLVWSWMSHHDIPQFPVEESMQRISSMVVSVGGFRGLSPFLGDLVKLRGMWEQCRSWFRFNERTGRLLDALYETNFMGMESTRDTTLISYREAPASSDGHDDQVHIARSADSINSLLLQLGECHKAKLLKEKILQGWNYGNQCHDWFEGEGSSLLFNVPLVMGGQLKAMLLNVVYSSCMDSIAPQFLVEVLIINHTKPAVKYLKGDSATFHEDAEWQSIISSVQPGDHLEVIVWSIGPQFHVQKIAAHLIYDDSKSRRLLK